jgi:CHAD domain-containing protein
MGRKSGLRPYRPVGEALVAVAHDILEEARAAIADPAKPDAVAVHDFRKAMKRWRAFLRLLEPIVGADARRLRDLARDLARALAAARDGQSALDALADLIAHAPQSGFSERSWNSIRARLDALRQGAETVALTESMRERLRSAIEAGTEAIAHWPLEDTRFWQVSEGLRESYARARRAIPTDWEDASDEELHDLRQRVVIHRYQMPLLEPLWPRFSRLWIAEAQRLRERLGTHQDLAVLAGLTALRQPLAPWRGRLLPLVAARKAVHVEAAARLARRLFAERPKAFRRRLDALWSAAAEDAD